MTTTAPLASTGIDIGKEVFHVVGFGTDGKIAFRRKIKRMALGETFRQLAPSAVGMEACFRTHFISRALRQLGHQPRITPAIYVKPFVKGKKNDYKDAEAIADAALRPNLRVMRDEDSGSARTFRPSIVFAPVWSRAARRRFNQIRAFLIEQGIAVRTRARALRNSLWRPGEPQDEISQRMRDLIADLYHDWICLDERIETIPIWPRMDRPPVLYWRGTRPSHAPKCRPRSNAPMGLQDTSPVPKKDVSRSRVLDRRLSREYQKMQQLTDLDAQAERFDDRSPA